jgi:nitrate/nitrite transporter NarK
MTAFAGRAGLAGWQWLFLLEALPALVVGAIVFAYLDNGIRSARWLTDDEKGLLERRLAEDSAHIEPHRSLGAVLADARVALMCLIYFTIVMGQYGLTFWMPTLIQAAGVRGTLNIGLFTAVPYGAGAVAMVFFGRSADRRRERRWHAAGAMLIGAAGMTLSAIAGTHTALAILFLTIASTGVFSSGPLFWSLPTAFLSGAAAAAGIAAINSIGNLAGFVSPYVVGWLKDLTNSTQAGMYAVSGVLAVGAVIILLFVPARLVNR